MGYGKSPTGRTVPSGSLFKPVEVGKEYTVDITHNGRQGDGIAHIQNFVIFVKKTKKGERNIKIKISSVADRFAIAEVAPAPAPAQASASATAKPNSTSQA